MDENIKRYTESTVRDFISYLLTFECNNPAKYISVVDVIGYDDNGDLVSLDENDFEYIISSFIKSKCNVIYQKED